MTSLNDCPRAGSVSRCELIANSHIFISMLLSHLLERGLPLLLPVLSVLDLFRPVCCRKLSDVFVPSSPQPPWIFPTDGVVSLIVLLYNISLDFTLAVWPTHLHLQSSFARDIIGYLQSVFFILKTQNLLSGHFSFSKDPCLFAFTVYL